MEDAMQRQRAVRRNTEFGYNKHQSPGGTDAPFALNTSRCLNPALENNNLGGVYIYVQAICLVPRGHRHTTGDTRVSGCKPPSSCSPNAFRITSKGSCSGTQRPAKQREFLPPVTPAPELSSRKENNLQEQHQSKKLKRI